MLRFVRGFGRVHPRFGRVQAPIEPLCRASISVLGFAAGVGVLCSQSDATECTRDAVTTCTREAKKFVELPADWPVMPELAEALATNVLVICSDRAWAEISSATTVRL